MSKSLLRTEKEIKPQPAAMRALAEDIVKQLLGNPVMATSWQYERIVNLIAEYTQAIKAELN